MTSLDLTQRTTPRQACRSLLRLTAAALVCALVLPAAALDVEAPPRNAEARTGSQIRDEIVSLSRVAREEFLYREFAAGNIPGWLRPMQPVTIADVADGTTRTAVYYVTPDYLAAGSDTDFFRIPMTPVLAQRIADDYNCLLPTRRMVDQIWAQTAIKIAPAPIPPSAEMVTVPVFYKHHEMVTEQCIAAGAAPGTFLGGHKKDVVISNQLPTYKSPLRVAIYGWHQLNGSPIQPLYFGHDNAYADYSHGIRLVHHEMLLDGTTVTVSSVLADPALCNLITLDGPIPEPRYPVGDQPGRFSFHDEFTGGARIGDLGLSPVTDNPRVPAAQDDPVPLGELPTE